MEINNKRMSKKQHTANMHQPSDCLKTFLQEEFIQTIVCVIKQMLKCKAV